MPREMTAATEIENDVVTAKLVEVGEALIADAERHNASRIYCSCGCGASKPNDGRCECGNLMPCGS